MSTFARNIGLFASALSIAALVAMSGCGGSGASVAGSTIAQQVGCGGVLSNANLTIQYPARSRDADLTHNLSSALSAKVVITGGAASGNADVTLNVNRSVQIAAHVETYPLPNLSTGSHPVTVTFYSAADEGGVVVGSATATDTVTCAGHSLSAVSLVAKASSVAVTPVTLSTGAAATQLVFTVKDASGTVLAVDAGSAIFAATGTAATVTKDGLATPVSAGTISVTASVDGITSPAATITVTTPTAPTYRIVDLGAGETINWGRPLNDNGLALINSTDSPPIVNVVNVTTLATTSLGMPLNNVTLNNSDLIMGNAGNTTYYWQGPAFAQNILPGSYQVLAVGDSGSAAGLDASSNATYWSSVTATPAPLGSVGGDPNHWVEPRAINSSGVIVGMAFYTTQFDACYYPSPSAGQATLLPAFSSGAAGQALSINDSGAIVGMAANGSKGYAVIWDSYTSAPRDLGTIGTPGGAEAHGINNAGVVVGIDSNAPTTNRAFVYTPSSGIHSLYDQCDNSRSGWQLLMALSVNNHGWIYGRGLFGGAIHPFVAIPTASG